MKFCMKGTSVHIKDIMELNSSVIIRFEILLWLFGCENVSGPSRNGPQGTPKSKKYFQGTGEHKENFSKKPSCHSGERYARQYKFRSQSMQISQTIQTNEN